MKKTGDDPGSNPGSSVRQPNALPAKQFRHTLRHMCPAAARFLPHEHVTPDWCHSPLMTPSHETGRALLGPRYTRDKFEELVAMQKRERNKILSMD